MSRGTIATSRATIAAGHRTAIEPDTGTEAEMATGSEIATGSEMATGPGGEVMEGDGRRLRRDRNRRAVVDALLDLYSAGNLRPSTAEIAGRAGLSPRSLFRYFDDIEDLGRAAIERQQQRARPLLRIEVTPTAPLAARVDALVAQRTRLFEAVAAAATVSRLQAPFQPALAAELTRSRALLRGQIAELFGAELAVLGSRAASALAAADVLCSFESHQLLRLDQGLPVAKVRAVLAAALAALLGPASAAAHAPAG